MPTRTVSWADSAPLHIALERSAGFDVLRDVAAGRLPLPPIAALLDVELARVEPGEVEVFAYLGDVHAGFVATVHPALVAAVLEFTAEAGITTLAAPGTEVEVAEFTVDGFEAVPPHGGPLRCHARATSAADGRVTAIANATALRAETAVAHARALGCLRPRAAAPA